MFRVVFVLGGGSRAPMSPERLSALHWGRQTAARSALEAWRRRLFPSFGIRAAHGPVPYVS